MHPRAIRDAGHICLCRKSRDCAVQCSLLPRSLLVADDRRGTGNHMQATLQKRAGADTDTLLARNIVHVQ
jgi:hypothetical protein